MGHHQREPPNHRFGSKPPRKWEAESWPFSENVEHFLWVLKPSLPNCTSSVKFQALGQPWERSLRGVPSILAYDMVVVGKHCTCLLLAVSREKP